MQIKPQHFVGRDVFKHFDSDDCVWHGRVLETFKNKHLPENCWVVRYPPEPDFPDGYEEDWDHGDMLRYGIDFIHGRACTSAKTWPHKARKPAMSVRARVSSPPRLEDVAANAAVDSADNPMSNSGGVQYLTLRQTMTWEEVVDTLGVNDLGPA